MNGVAYFEIHSSQPEREIQFYKKIFGWNFIRETNPAIEYYRIENAGINAALLKRPTDAPDTPEIANAFVCSIQVSDFDVTGKLILECGGRIFIHKFPIKGRCWQGYFTDHDKNNFGIFQVDEKAP